MGTFLSICQDVAREIGTIPSPENRPATTESQTGALNRIVQYVQDAHRDVQLHREDWRFLRARFEANSVASQSIYTPTNLGISRFGAYHTPGDFDQDNERRVSLYDVRIGLSDERVLEERPWDEFRRDTQMGPNISETGRPRVYSFNTSDNLVLWPTPDVAVYKIKGPYVKSPFVFSSDSDQPEFRSQYHDVIRYAALIKLAAFEEAQPSPEWLRQYRKLLSDMERVYLPEIRNARPLA